MKCLFAWIFLPIAFWICSIDCAPDSDYAYPRILILGPTGVGKSSLASVISRCAPGECLFPVCTSINSCTKNTSIVQGKFIGNFSGPDILKVAGNVTIVDTPGFGDGDLEEPTLVGEMVHVLKEDLKWANLIVLCFDGIRWDAQINVMLETLQTLFGENLWRNTIIEVTKWAFDEKNIQDRKRRGITEEDTLLAINNQLKKNFHLNDSLPGVFLDSFAVYYPDDEVQTRFFRKYSMKLWEAAMYKKPFSFDAVGQVKDSRISACGIDNDCCKNLTNEINDLKNEIDDLKNHAASNTNEMTKNRVTLAFLTIEVNHVKESTNNNTHDILELTGNVFDNAQCIDDLIVTDSTINDRIGHIDERLNENTLNIVNNSFALQANKKQIDINTETIKSIIDSNGTITVDIETMKTNIGQNTNNIRLNTENIDTNNNNIDSNINNIDSNTNKIDINTDNIETNKKTIDTLTETTSRFVSYCGYRRYRSNTDSTGTLTYSRLVTSINSFSRGGLDIATGVFTPPTTGTYLVNSNFWTDGAGTFLVYINKNGHNLEEGVSRSKSMDDDWDMTGRTLILQLETNDKLYLNVTENAYYIDYITFCITLIK